jgi:uncharacterized protein
MSCARSPDSVDIFHALPPADLGVLALGLVIAGVVGGLIAGVLGIGAGIVVVPVLYHVLATLGLDESVRMHLAVGTALAASIPAGLSHAHDRLGDADRAVLRSWVLAVVAGVAIGSVAMAVANGHALALIFAIVTAAVLLNLMLRGEERLGAIRLPQFVGGYVLPALIGALSALTGMGGTTLAGPAVALRGVSPGKRTATVAILGAIVSVPAALGAAVAGWRAQLLPPVSLGYVNLLGFALIAPILLLAEPAGAALAHLVDVKRLRLAFTVLVAIITARMLWDALT